MERLRLIPTGIGEARTLTAPPGQHYVSATTMADGKKVLIVAAAAGHAPATYLQDIETGSVRQITSEGKYTVVVDDAMMSVSPDGRYTIITDGEDHYWLQPLDGGEASEIKALSEGDHPLQWHNDSQNIFVEHVNRADTAEIYALNLTTDQRKLWTRFSPPDKAAMIAMRHPLITPDGAHTLYTVQRIFSTLFLAKGI
jgi:Tol biopolymer transport system component